jgi:cobalamin 5'-phosphate synthase/cobalamin synthase
MRRAIGFLTVLGGPSTPDGRTFDWFPLAGIAIGAAVGGVWWATDEVWPPAVAAALVVVADLAITGALHYDGLIDSADGLLPHLDRQRRLAVMAEPSVGAFGVTVVAGVLLLRYAALVSMRPSVLLIAGLWCQSRAAMALAATSLPIARPGSLISGFAPLGATRATARPALAGMGLVLSLVLAAVGTLAGPGAAAGVAAVLAGSAGIGALLWLAHRRLGGVTGDVLGAAGVVGETCGLVVAAARW